MKKEIEAIDAKMPYKASTSQIREIMALLEELPTKEETDTLTNKLHDSISTFTKDNNEFKEAYVQQNEMLRRYDEVLTTKANKQGLYQEIDKVNKTFLPNLKSLKEGEKVTKKMVEKLKNEIVMIEKNVE